MKKLSHYDERGRASMVDVSAKPETKRTAEAHAFVRIKRSVLNKLPDNPKGNPLEVARFAGISAFMVDTHAAPGWSVNDATVPVLARQPAGVVMWST